MARPAKAPPPAEETSGEKVFTAAERKVLFERYDAVKKEYDEAQAELVAVGERRCAVVKEIFESLGAGPFKWKGKEMSISNRNGNFFFRGEPKKQVTEIG